MRKYCLITLLTVLMLLLVPGFFSAAHEEMPSGKYYTLVDDKNQIIHQTGIKVNPGDIYIAADNSKYQVIDIIGSTARCKYQGKETMPYYNSNTAASWYQKAVPVVGKGKKPTIAVYHTHSDESYVPSDGKDSINGNGGIYDVGAALVSQLKAQGFNVQYNKQNHNPHDVNAYNRSRKTAAALLKKAPDVILDVHRDAVPASEYQATVKGQEVTKVKLVVGKSNPNMKTNLEFAKRLKAVMDKKEPGLSNGIYIGKGDYNQDLSPRAMLIEVGADKNNKKDAQQGVKLFAQTLPAVLGVTPGSTGAGQNTAAQKPLTQENNKAGSTVLVILLVVAATAGGYYLLNKGKSTQK